MNKVALIFSSDYELFGDGSGTVLEEQITPTNNTIDILEQYGAKLTVMFEYGQYLAYEKYASEDNTYKIDNQLIKNQLIDLVKRGHGVQLHYHAQWHDAQYDTEKKSFKLNLDYVDITSLEYETMVNVLGDGKEFLEELLIPYNKNYQCIGFRAGSWAVKDEKKLLKALKETGFKVDSSVVSNTKFESEQVNFEYKNSPHQYLYWYIDESLSTRSLKQEFIEIPIYTKKSPFASLKYLNKTYKNNRNYVKQKYKTKISENNFTLKDKIKKVYDRNYYMADLNTMAHSTLLQMIDDVIIENENIKCLEDIIPIMFIAHSKTSHDIENIKLFLDALRRNYSEKVLFFTMQDIANTFIKENSTSSMISISRRVDTATSQLLPILGKEEYLKTKSDEYGWFMSNNFIIPFYIDKHFIFKRLVFSTEPISRKKILDIQHEKIFLDDIIDYVKKNKICDFIFKAQSNVVFNICPKKSKCVEWGTYKVDILKSQDDLFASFDTKSRNVIRKAIKEGVSVKEEIDIRVIYQNIKETLERQKSIHFPSLEYLTKVAKLSKGSKCLVALKDGVVQGSLVLLYDSHNGYAMYAGSVKSPQVGSLDLLHFEAMKLLQLEGVKSYDFVGTRINIKKGSKQEGIDRFKKKFKPKLIQGYAFRTVINPFKYLLYIIAIKLYSFLKGIKYKDPIREISAEELENTMLLIGPRFNRENPEMVGGPIVLFEGLIEELKKSNIKFSVIDTNKKNYRGHIFAYFVIISKIIFSSSLYNQISFHSSRDYMLFSPFILLKGKLFSQKTSLRKFGGEAKNTYINSNIVIKKYLHFIFKNYNTVFLETKYLVDFFSTINSQTNWFPNVRKRKLTPVLPREFKKKFVFISHVIREKGIDELIQASQSLDSSYTIDIYGPIFDDKYSEELFEKTNVSYKGALKSSEVLNVLNMYDVVVLPSYKEGYPGIIVEAYSLGMPVITTNLESISEIVDDYETGILIETKSSQQLIEAIQYFDNTNYIEFSKKAYKKFDLFESTLSTKKFLENL